MSTVDPKDLADFSEQADAWFAENVARDPGFMLPLTFMEVGTDTQFNFLRDWQNKVWEAGYLGAAWPKAYGMVRPMPLPRTAVVVAEPTRMSLGDSVPSSER
jgi:alkylation response protein AidB-like acyl-CoA dehydrogenase